jgi:hypothetical protein
VYHFKAERTGTAQTWLRALWQCLPESPSAAQVRNKTAATTRSRDAKPAAAAAAAAAAVVGSGDAEFEALQARLARLEQQDEAARRQQHSAPDKTIGAETVTETPEPEPEPEPEPAFKGEKCPCCFLGALLCNTMICQYRLETGQRKEKTPLKGCVSFRFVSFRFVSFRFVQATERCLSS